MTAPPPHTEGIAFAEVYAAFRAHRRGILGFVLALTIVAGVGSFLLPSWYGAGAEFSIESAPTLTQPAGVLGLAAQFGLSGTSGTNTINYYADLLGSNQVIDRVALHRLPWDSTGRERYYYTSADSISTPKDRDRVRRTMQGHLDISANTRTNTIAFTVEARTPFGARLAAETLLTVLNESIIALRRQRASAERAFLESRVDTAVDRQHLMEDSLRQFYIHNRQVNTPNLIFSEARLKREVEFSQTLVSQLRSQLEQARLQEVRDTPALSTISTPEIPGRRSRPNRKLIVVAAFLAGVFLSFSWIAARLTMRRL